MKALAHNVMNIHLQVTVNKNVSFIEFVFSNIAKQRLPMISSELTDD